MLGRGGAPASLLRRALEGGAGAGDGDAAIREVDTAAVSGSADPARADEAALRAQPGDGAEAGVPEARRKLKLALDTTNVLGWGAVKDTYNLLADGIVG